MPQTHNQQTNRSATSSRIEVTSPAFTDGARIPARYTADGEDISPPLEWSELPAQTKSVAIVCEDPAAPSGIFFHWTAWNLAPSQRRVQEGAGSAGAGAQASMRQGENGFCKQGYGGPKPPPGTPHRYIFTVAALDTELDLKPGSTRRDFDAAIEGHVLASGCVVGVYGRDGTSSKERS